MSKQIVVAAAAAMSMLVMAAPARAAEPTYQLLKPVAVSGAAERQVVSYRALPLDRGWAQFTSSEVELVRNQYADLRAHEEPPFPVGGLGTLARELSALQQAQNLRGEVQAVISVDASGRGTAVTWQSAPAPTQAAALEAVLRGTRFEPATCAHTACAMAFPLHVEFGETLLALN